MARKINYEATNIFGKTPTINVMPDDTAEAPVKENRPKLRKRKVLDITCLIENEDNEFNMHEDDEFRQLVESIKKEGFSGDIHAKPNPAMPGTYIILKGHRRKKAATIAGLEQVPVYIWDEEMSKSQEIATMSRDNITARQNNTYDMAKMIKLYYGYLEEEGVSLSSSDRKERAMEDFGIVSERSMYNYDMLTYLPDDLLNLGQDKLLTRDAGIQLATTMQNRPESAEEMITAIRLISEDTSLSTDDKKNKIELILRGKKSSPVKEKPVRIDAFKTVKKAEKICQEFEKFSDDEILLPKKAAKREDLLNMCDKLIACATRCKARLEEE